MDDLAHVLHSYPFDPTFGGPHWAHGSGPT
jgi:hypothetical protein